MKVTIIQRAWELKYEAGNDYPIMKRREGNPESLKPLVIIE